MDKAKRIAGGSIMAKYVCGICGFVYDEEKEGKPFSQLEKCPVCQQPASVFVKQEEKKTVKNFLTSIPLTDCKPAARKFGCVLQKNDTVTGMRQKFFLYLDFI